MNRRSWAVRYARFVWFMVTLVVATAIAWWVKPADGVARALMLAFDIATVQFLAALVPQFREDDAALKRERASDNEPDHHTLLFIGALVIGIVMLAVGSELSDSRAISVLLSVSTLTLAWVFGNLLFSLHYAHVYYTRGPDGDYRGIEFPGDNKDPDHWDFAYFAFVLGMTFQVSDVVITGRRMRRLALLHGLLGFIYNIGAIAITVGIIGNLFQAH